MATLLYVLYIASFITGAHYEASHSDTTKWRNLYCPFKRVFVDARFCSTVKNRVRLLTSRSPGVPHKGIINASQSRCGAERIASIKCNFGRVPILNFG